MPASSKNLPDITNPLHSKFSNNPHNYKRLT